MGLKKIVVMMLREDEFGVIGYDQNGISFSGHGLTANEAIGDLIFSYGIKFDIEIETEDRRGRFLGL